MPVRPQGLLRESKGQVERGWTRGWRRCRRKTKSKLNPQRPLLVVKAVDAFCAGAVDVGLFVDGVEGHGAVEGEGGRGEDAPRKCTGVPTPGTVPYSLNLVLFVGPHGALGDDGRSVIHRPVLGEGRLRRTKGGWVTS
jgi:hypothetical protein